MSYKSILFQIILFFSFSIFCIAQDTITVMQYNLLKYNISGSACIPIATKTANIKTIVKYVMPDILGVNEIYPGTTTIDYLLNNALNTDGITYYQKANYTNLANSPDMINVLYYNGNKLHFVSNTPVQTLYRDINIFKLYYKAADLATTHDTTYINVVIAHLKASNSAPDAADRATMTNALTAYLNNINSANNYLCQGDFNLYTSTEQAYQNLIGNSNANMRFYDPINRAGNWANNTMFKDIHTQSTHNYGNLNNCFVAGGMDDRFDFILISKDVRDGTKKALYIPGSYKAVGQDGLHMNNDLTATPTNTSVLPAVLNALYNNSDHLPVTLKLKITTGSQSVAELNIKDLNVLFNNPVSEALNITFDTEKSEEYKIQIMSVLGSILYEKNVICDAGQTYFNIPFLFPKGIYLMRIIDRNYNKMVRKIIKQ